MDKKLIYIGAGALAVIIIVGVFVLLSSPRFPEEAKLALQRYADSMYEASQEPTLFRIEPDTVNTSYRIVSAEKATNLSGLAFYGNEEVWCVVTDPPIVLNNYSAFVSRSELPLRHDHFFLKRHGLTWSVDGGVNLDGKPYHAGNFLYVGCKNGQS